MDKPAFPRESTEVAIAYEHVDDAIHDLLAAAGKRAPRPRTLREMLRTIRDNDPFLNENPRP